MKECLCVSDLLTSVGERNIKEESELFRWRTELVTFFKGWKEPLSSAEVRWGVIGFLLHEVSAGAKTERCLQSKNLVQTLIIN